MAALRTFLSAEWRDLLMLNYEVDPDLLERFVPRGTELDSFAGKTYASLVGFQFLRTRLGGFLAVPFHSNFDEVNLRFYVRRDAGGERRRGVVFVKEIVPRQLIAGVARAMYGEKYERCPMRHGVTRNGDLISTSYEWQFRGDWCALSGTATGAPEFCGDGSLEQFITEHYWGYSSLPNGGALEYQVTHVPWRVWSSKDARFSGDGDALYGAGFGEALRGRPASAFIAEGSAVSVHWGQRIAK
jgi:uncharacterized protein YqjF (DUF2071 family)